MGKKQKRGGKQSVVLHREAFMRMNFLLQVSLEAKLHLCPRIFVSAGVHGCSSCRPFSPAAVQVLRPHHEKCGQETCP